MTDFKPGDGVKVLKEFNVDVVETIETTYYIDAENEEEATKLAERGQYLDRVGGDVVHVQVERVEEE